MTPELEEELAAQEAALAHLGLEIWTGAEPTFTDLVGLRFAVTDRF